MFSFLSVKVTNAIISAKCNKSPKSNAKLVLNCNKGPKCNTKLAPTVIRVLSVPVGAKCNKGPKCNNWCQM